MKPLIEIKNVPISIEYKVNSARIERKSTEAQIEIQRDPSKLTIKSSPIKLNIDTYESRNSILPTPMRAVKENAQHGKKTAYEATARMAEEGQLLVQIHLNNDTLGDISASRLESNRQFELGFSPSIGPEISWDDAEIMIKYEMDKMSFDLREVAGDYEFIPGNIEFKILEYNKVIIEYIGDPIYVPPSAAPGYEPVDVKV